MNGILLFAAVAISGAADCVIQPKSTVELGSSEAGIIKQVLVARGDVVKKGDLLLRLDSSVEKLSTELAQLRASTDINVRSQKAEATYRRGEVDRVESLRHKQALSEAVYDQAVIEVDLADLAVESAEMDRRIAKVELRRANAVLKRRSIYSPVNGAIVKLQMSPGEFVHEQSQIMTIAEIDPLNVEVYLPVANYGSVLKGMVAVVKPEEPIGGEYRAKVTVVDSVFDAASRTFGVRLELPNPNHSLPAGLRCTVSFEDADVTDEAGL